MNRQPTQIALFRILGYWLDNKINPDTLIKGNKFTNEGDKPLDNVLEGLGLTGAQFGAARATAWQFLKYGYAEMMKKCPKDRAIQVSKVFPSES